MESNVSAVCVFSWRRGAESPEEQAGSAPNPGGRLHKASAAFILRSASSDIPGSR